jgi:hypothetical protein
MEEQAEIDAVVRQLPSESWLREKTKDWPVEKFDYATERVSSVCKREQWIAAKEQLKEFRAARAEELIEKRAIERELEDRRTAKERHEETLKETRQGTEIAKGTLSWTKFVAALTVIIVVLTVILVVLTIVELVCR